MFETKVENLFLNTNHLLHVNTFTQFITNLVVTNGTTTISTTFNTTAGTNTVSEEEGILADWLMGARDNRCA
jgi:hypothetical protein